MYVNNPITIQTVINANTSADLIHSGGKKRIG
jgi:hypothetical protein